MCELRAQEAVPCSPWALCLQWGPGEAAKGGAWSHPWEFFALARPCQSQNRLIIHSCLFAERTRAQSVLNSYPKGLIPKCLHRCAQGLGRCPPALEASTELGLQEDQIKPQSCVSSTSSVSSWSCCSSWDQLLDCTWGCSWGCLCHPSPTSAFPPCLEQHLPSAASPQGPACAGREFRDSCGTCWHRGLGFSLVCQDFVFR